MCPWAMSRTDYLPASLAGAGLCTTLRRSGAPSQNSQAGRQGTSRWLKHWRRARLQQQLWSQYSHMAARPARAGRPIRRRTGSPAANGVRYSLRSRQPLLISAAMSASGAAGAHHGRPL